MKIFIHFLFRFFVFFMIIMFLGCASSGTKIGQLNEFPEEPISYPSTSPKSRVAIFDFKNVSFFESKTLGPGSAAMFETALVNSNHFIVIDRENLIKIIEEHKLKQAGITSSALSDIVQQSGVEYIITGAVTEFGIKKTGTSYGAGVVDTRSLAGGGAKIKKEKGTARIVIDIKITETKTGNIVYKGAASGEAFSDNVNLGLGILTGSDIAAGVTVGSGVIGFDETIAGQAARVAAYELVNKIMKDIQL